MRSRAIFKKVVLFPKSGNIGQTSISTYVAALGVVDRLYNVCCRRLLPSGPWARIIQTLSTGDFQLLRGIWNSKYSPAAFIQGQLVIIKLCSVQTVVCSVNESRTLSIYFFSAGFSIICIMNRFLGCLFSPVLMICSNLYLNSLVTVYYQDTATDTVPDT